MKQVFRNLINYRRPRIWIAALLSLVLIMICFRLLSDQKMLGSEAENYEFESLLYLSPLSSSTFDYAESKLKGTRLTISNARFEIDYPDENHYLIEQPRYVRETMTDDMVKAFEKSTFEEVSITDLKKKYRYTIYTSDHLKTNYHLYLMDNQIWLSSYADNTADKSEITMQLWKLKPQSDTGSSGPVPNLPAEKPPTQEQLAMRIMDNMTMEEKVGQMFFVRCRKESAIADLEQYSPGGFILFGEDIKGESRETLESKIQSYQDASALKLLIGVDEEGGGIVRISRYPEFRAVPFHSPQSLYEEGGYPLVTSDTTEKATLLKSLGFNVNLAPVCDVSTSPEDYIYNRTFGRNAEETATYVKTVVETMNSNKIGCTLKHFPGYGSNTDTHKGLAVDNRSYDSFLSTDFIPFRSGIEAGAGSILVSHTIVTCMDEELPASLSPAVHRILREDLGFEGVVMTDDLKMDAIREYYGDEASAVMAVKAGNDFIISSYFDVQIPAVLSAVEAGSISEDRINESVLKILMWKLRLGIIS